MGRKKNVIPLRWMQTQGFIVLYPTSFVPLAGVEVHVPYGSDRGSDAVGKKSISTPNFRRDYVYDLSSPLYDSRIQVISCSATLLEKSSEGYSPVVHKNEGSFMTGKSSVLQTVSTRYKCLFSQGDRHKGYRSLRPDNS